MSGLSSVQRMSPGIVPPFILYPTKSEYSNKSSGFPSSSVDVRTFNTESCLQLNLPWLREMEQ